MTLPPKALREPFVLENDWVTGGVTGIEHEDRNPSGDWTQDLPTREPQKFKFDTNECSTISATKNLEIQFNFLKRTNQFSAQALQWFTNNGYIDKNGNFNFSERFSGIMAGTSINGNSQNYVWESIRKTGLLPQSDLSYSLEQSQKFTNQYDMCEDYYNPDVVTKTMEAKAKLIFRWVTISYEWVWANANQTAPLDKIQKALKQSPVQIGTPVCPGWNDGTVNPCGDHAVAHATNTYKANQDGSLADFDHYNPYLKTLAAGYFIPYAVKAVVSVNQVSEPSVGTIVRLLEILRQLGVWSRGVIEKAWTM